MSCFKLTTSFFTALITSAINSAFYMNTYNTSNVKDPSIINLNNIIKPNFEYLTCQFSLLVLILPYIQR